MSSKKTLAKAFEGAVKVIELCLGLHSGDDLLIVTDENTTAVAYLIQAAAVSAGVSSGIVLVPTADQIRCHSQEDIAIPIKNAMRDVQAIMTCVTDLSEAMNFRKAIIDEGRFYGTKIANCPGIDVSMLANALNVDYDRMVKQCNLLARTLIRGASAEIVTYDHLGQSHELLVGLGRWNRVPVASTGIIHPGLWGNVPSGETYLAPLEDTADGEIVINGSVPDYALGKDEEILLTFRTGMVRSIEPHDNRGTRILIEKLLGARASGDEHDRKLGELGIGLNPRVRRLTGNSLMDEKKAKTAHIALGDNTIFGGENKANVHLDLVTLRPTITVDHKKILRRGLLVMNEKEWLEDYEQVVLPYAIAMQMIAVTQTGNEIDENGQADLKRKFIDDTGPGRTVSVGVGNARTSRLAARVFRKISKADKTPIQDLAAMVQLEQLDVLKLVWLMKDYELVDVFDADGKRLG